MISGLASAAAQDAEEDDGFDRLPESFRRAYERHFDFVWRNLRRLGVPDRDLEDAVQETFVVAYRRRASFRSGASPRGWLYGIVRKIAWRFRRGEGRRGRLRLAVADLPEPEVDLGQTVEVREAWRMVEQFVAGLSDEKRDVFVLAELEGMTGAEIATLLRINPNTVGSRLRAGREAFARHLATMDARERGAKARLERSAMIEAGRRAPGADRRQRASVGSALALQLGSPSVAGWWATAAGLRVFLLTVVVGTAGVAVTAAALPDRDPPTAAAEREVAVQPTAATPSEPVSSMPTREPPRAEPTSEPAVVEASAPPAPSLPTAVPSRSQRRAAAAPTDDLSAEASSLRQINLALRGGRPAEALRLADAHARRFTAGKLAIEAAALRVTALCDLGRGDEARRHATALRRAVPHHPAASVAVQGCPAATIARPTDDSPTKENPAGEAEGI